MITLKEIKKIHAQQNIKVAVDNCIFTVIEGKLYVLLIKMKYKFPGKWALPGGLVNNKETLDRAAKGILKEETGVNNVYLEQLYAFGKIDRDPFNRVISVAYFTLIPSTQIKLKTTSKYLDVAWCEFSKVPHLVYDHNQIVKYAKKRLKYKIIYTNVVWSLLPPKFTLTELQKAYEVILERKLDKRNFRRKILNLNLIRPVGEKTKKGTYRPAGLYYFKSKRIKIVEIF